PSPDDERPSGAVPKPAEEHRRKEVEIPPRGSLPAAAEGNVDVVAQEPRQGHMPPPPEFNDAGRLIGRCEVDREPNAKKQGRGDRHIGVAGKVKVKLGGISERRAPGAGEIERLPGRRRVEERGRIEGGGVGEKDLLRQAEGEEGQPDRRQFYGGGSDSAELGKELAGVDDRAGDQLRKEADEEGKVEEVQPSDSAAICIDEEGDLLERKERDAERQNDPGRMETASGERIEVVDEEIGIFEIAEHRQIAGDPEYEQPFGG